MYLYSPTKEQIERRQLSDDYCQSYDLHNAEEGHQWYNLSYKYSTTSGIKTLDEIIQQIALDLVKEDDGFKIDKNMKVLKYVTTVTTVDILPEYKDKIKTEYKELIKEKKEYEQWLEQQEEDYWYYD